LVSSSIFQPLLRLWKNILAGVSAEEFINWYDKTPVLEGTN